MSKNGRNGKKDELADIREMMRMANLQTIENARQIALVDKQLSKQISRMAREHDREMKEIRALFKQMIKRLAV